jgi:hypothetical protein
MSCANAGSPRSFALTSTSTGTASIPTKRFDAGESRYAGKAYAYRLGVNMAVSKACETRESEETPAGDGEVGRPARVVAKEAA